MTTDFPRYFCHRTEYLPPNHYYRVDSADTSVSVEPATGKEAKVGYPLAYYLQPAEGKSFIETTKAKIDEGMAKWKRFNPAPAKV